MPEFVEPAGSLQTSAEEARRRKRSRKGKELGNVDQSGEKVAARQDQYRAPANNHELRNQKHRRNQVIDKNEGLRDWNEGFKLSKLHACKRRRDSRRAQ